MVMKDGDVTLFKLGGSFMHTVTIFKHGRYSYRSNAFIQHGRPVCRPATG